MVDHLKRTDGRIPAQALPRRLVESLQGLGLCLTVAAMTWVTVTLLHRSGQAAIIWPVNAVVLICLLRTDRRRWPGLLVAMLVGNFTANCLLGPPLIALGLSAANLVEVLICAVGLRRFAGRQVDFLRRRDLFIFGALVAIASPLSALLATACLHRLGGVGGYSDFAVWALGGAMGMVLIVPSCMILTRQTLRDLAPTHIGLRAALLLGAYVAVVILIFADTRHALIPLVVPALLLLILEIGPAAAALGVALTALLASGFAIVGRGPAEFMSDGPPSQMIVVRLFLVLTLLSVLQVAATLAQRRRLQDELRASLARANEAQRLWELAEEVANLAYWRLDVATSAITWSPEMFNIFGLSGGAPPTVEASLAAVHPEDASENMNNLTRALNEGVEFRSGFRIVRPDGSWRRLRCRTVCERGADGAVTALFGTAVDVTDMVLADEALRASEARYRLLAENASDMIMQTDLEGRLVYISPSVTHATGFLPEELQGKDAHELMHREDALKFKQVLRKLIETRGRWASPRVEFRARGKDGRWLWFETQSSPLFNAATGELEGIIDVARDMTARKALEADLREQRIQAEAATQAKSEFLANMSHEIRTPLTGVIGFSDLLSEMDQLPERAEVYVRRIGAAGRALLSVVNDVLDFSKLEAGQIELDPQPFDPMALVEDTLDLVAIAAANKGLDLSVEVADPPPALVEADGGRLRQVLLNLLNNAIKFTDSGAIKVLVNYDPVAGALHVAVRDTGVGIPHDRRDRLFQRFSQVDGSISRRHGGSGLGLAICRSLVQLMGGRIGVDSAEGEGSTFRFTVAAPAAPARFELASEPAAAPREEDHGRAAHILVADDVSINRQLVRAMLVQFGHTFEEAANGLEAVEAAMRTRFDLILMDLQMPGMDGLTAARAIRATGDINRDTPIVALTANVLPEHFAACRAAGMNDHVAKPINPAELLAKSSRWLGSGDRSTADSGVRAGL